MIDYFDRMLDIIKDSLHSIDMERFEDMITDCINTLESGHKVIASGLGKNVPICEKFVGTMVSLGLDAYFLHTNSAVHGDLGIVKDGDLVIILTKSGETEESVYLAKKLSERKVTVWLLSFSHESILTKQIPNSLILNLKHEGDLWNIMPNNSTTLNLIVLQGLAMEIARRQNLDISQFKRNHPGGHIGNVLNDEKG